MPAGGQSATVVSIHTIRQWNWTGKRMAKKSKDDKPMTTGESAQVQSWYRRKDIKERMDPKNPNLTDTNREHANKNPRKRET